MFAMDDFAWDIAVDLDGVLYDFVEVFAAEARRYPHLRVPHSPRPIRWEFYRDWGMESDEFLEMFAVGVREGRIFWSGPSYAGVVQGWARLRKHGHRVHIITDRSPAGAEVEAHQATQSWLAANGFDPDSLTITSQKGDALADLVKDPARALIVDDKPENLDQAWQVGVRGVLMDRPWNTHSNWPRVRSFTQFAALVADETQGRTLVPFPTRKERTDVPSLR